MKFTKNKIASVLFLILIIILIINYRYSSKRLELWGYYDKVWAHRVNDLKKLKSAAPKFKGLELDLVYDSLQKDFRVNHPPQDFKGLYFSSYLHSLQDKNKPLWLDIKNLNARNDHQVLNTLDSLFIMNHIFRKRSVLIESTDINSLKVFFDSGYRTSWYITAIINESNKEDIIKDIDSKIIDFEYEISSNYKNYRYLSEAFPNRDKNFWILTSTYDFETVSKFDLIRKMLKDESVKTVLIPYINFNRHY